MSLNNCADDARIAYPLFQEEYGGEMPTSALQLKFSRTTLENAITLNRLWHSRLPEIDWTNVVRNKAYDCFVAECANIFFATAIWSSPIARLLPDSMYELRRMAIAPDAPKNTASRMLAWMAKQIRRERPNVTTLISYQDTEVHKGTIYKASGWRSVHTGTKGGWDRPNRFRVETQTPALKVRWELGIRQCRNYLNFQKSSLPTPR